MHMITFSLSTLSLIIIILASSIIILIGIILDLYAKLRKFTRGKNGASLEEVLNTIHTQYASMEKTHGEIINHHTILSKKMETAIRGAQIIRFNPFKDSGGNQSFACALINESGNGMVLSTLFARDRMSIFGKPLENFSSPQTLTQEEQQAVDDARKQLGRSTT